MAPRLTFATGFGAEGCVIIDLVGRNNLPVDLFTLDTGLLFPETYELWRQLEARYGITIRAVKPTYTVEQQAELHGPALWERDPDACCEHRKYVPLRRDHAGFDAWITAIRRDQTPGARTHADRRARSKLIWSRSTRSSREPRRRVSASTRTASSSMAARARLPRRCTPCTSGSCSENLRAGAGAARQSECALPRWRQPRRRYIPHSEARWLARRDRRQRRGRRIGSRRLLAAGARIPSWHPRSCPIPRATVIETEFRAAHSPARAGSSRGYAESATSPPRRPRAVVRQHNRRRRIGDAYHNTASAP
jgi:hypothetical protein